MPPFIQAVIRLGFTDLLLLETPPHAAVSSTVNLLGTRSTQRYRGMVNAVLRRADREREDFLDHSVRSAHLAALVGGALAGAVG